VRLPFVAPPGWWVGARCRVERIDLALFFTREKATEAQAVCAECPVRVRCLTDHLEEPFGVWGGHPADERRRIEAEMDRGTSLVEASRAIRRPHGQG